MLVILFGGLLAFVILAWDKASGLSVEEKRETGILKAVGWETSDVILLKFWEGLAISLSSFSHRSHPGLCPRILHFFSPFRARAERLVGPVPEV